MFNRHDRSIEATKRGSYDDRERWPPKTASASASTRSAPRDWRKPADRSSDVTFCAFP